MEESAQRTEPADGRQPGDQGFMLLGLIVAIALILLALSVAATQVAFSLRREREVESARRADQYVRAIRRFYLKTQHYPGSIEQLVKTNNVRYLRQQYIDPLTGKADYRLILVGQNKTTVKGFFGEPLTGLATTGLGTAAGMVSPGFGGAAGATGAGAAGGAGVGSGAGASGAGATGGGSAASGTTGGTPGTPGVAGATDASASTPFGNAGVFGSAAGTGLSATAGPFMGVGSSATGDSIIEPNEQTSYQKWEFLYDPRIELLKAKSALNSGLGSTGAGALGQTTGAPGFSSPTDPGAPAQAPGNSGFGSPNGTGTTGAGTTGGTQPTKP